MSDRRREIAERWLIREGFSAGDLNSRVCAAMSEYTAAVLAEEASRLSNRIQDFRDAGTDDVSELLVVVHRLRARATQERKGG